MVKVVGFPAPVNISGLKPGSAFQVGDTAPPLYGVTVKAGDLVTAILLGQVEASRRSVFAVLPTTSSASTA